MRPKKPSGGIDMPIETILLVIIIFFLLYQVSGTALPATAERIGNNPYATGLIVTLKIMTAVIAIAAGGAIGYLVIQNGKIRPTIGAKKVLLPGGPRKLSSNQVTGRFRNEWVLLRTKLDTASDNDAPMLVIEADAIADKALTYLRVPGETMGERMKFISTPDFKSADDLWEAHKMRNEIAHGGGRNFLYVDALYAIEKYEKALKELGVV